MSSYFWELMMDGRLLSVSAALPGHFTKKVHIR